jgi:hypothetical protein
VTDVRQEDRTVAYGKESLQNMGQEDSKILHRIITKYWTRGGQNIGPEGDRMLTGQILTRGRQKITLEDFRILDKGMSEYWTGRWHNTRQAICRILERRPPNSDHEDGNYWTWGY